MLQKRLLEITFHKISVTTGYDIFWSRFLKRTYKTASKRKRTLDTIVWFWNETLALGTANPHLTRWRGYRTPTHDTKYGRPAPCVPAEVRGWKVGSGVVGFFTTTCLWHTRGASGWFHFASLPRLWCGAQVYCQCIVALMRSTSVLPVQRCCLEPKRKSDYILSRMQCKKKVRPGQEESFLVSRLTTRMYHST